MIDHLFENSYLTCLDCLGCQCESLYDLPGWLLDCSAVYMSNLSDFTLVVAMNGHCVEPYWELEEAHISDWSLLHDHLHIESRHPKAL